MNVDQEIAARTRDEIIGLLSEDELRSIAIAEQDRIPEGDQYLDLDHLELGVLEAEPNTPGAHALPRSAVSDTTWNKILGVLATPFEA